MSERRGSAKMLRAFNKKFTPDDVRAVSAALKQVNIKQTGMDSRKFTDFLLNDCGICALAGANFGAEGEGYVRFSYANTIENLAEAADRIEKALSRK